MLTITNDILKVADAASKNPSRPVLTCVMLDNERIVATDSYVLLEAKRKGEDAGEFPEVFGITPLKELDTPVLIPAKELKKKLKFPKKQSLPIMEHAAITGQSKRHLEFTTTNLDSATRVNINTVEGNFPAYENVMPDANQHQGSAIVDAKKLIQILKAFTNKDSSQVRIKFYSELAPLMVEGVDEYNDNMRGLIMPLKV